MPTKLKPPTDGELEILRAMWRIGRSRTRAINKALNEDREIESLPALSFNTTATVLQKMLRKGFVSVDASDPTRHQYDAIQSEAEIAQVMASHVIKRMFRGSIVEAVRSAIQHKKPSRDELASLQTLLDQTGGKKK